MSSESSFVPGFSRQVAEGTLTAQARYGRASMRLTGRGGVALVMFHLARLGMEFTETIDNSDAGDLWVRTQDGRIIVVEVKTATGPTWIVRKAQMDRVQVYAFVYLPRGEAFLVPALGVASILDATGQRATGGLYSLARKILPPATEGAWSIFGSFQDGAVPVVHRAGGTRRAEGRPHVVRKVLVSGEVREYVYPPR